MTPLSSPPTRQPPTCVLAYPFLAIILSFQCSTQTYHLLQGTKSCTLNNTGMTLLLPTTDFNFDLPFCSFYGGNHIWRGHFTTSGQETAFNLTVQGGLVFGYSAYLNGVFLGSYAGTTSASLSNNVWQIPANTLVVGKDNVLTVLQGMY